MGLVDQTMYRIECDGHGCKERAGFGQWQDYELWAKQDAEASDFKEVEGQWLCSKCLTKLGLNPAHTKHDRALPKD